MTYAIGATVPRGAVTPALYWYTGDPKASRPRAYHYIRVQRAREGRDPHDLLIIGGEDHKTGQANDSPDRHARLERWARQRFPMIEELKFTWAGQVLEPVDGVAFIGRNPGDKGSVFIATGDSGMGMTHGVIAGILLCDLIVGRENPWTKLYDPSRITLSALGRYARENINMATQYVDWVTRGDIKSTENMEPDSGAVIRDGLSKLAVYRDASGQLHCFSAVCPHLGGIVHWNVSEKTWDCPCHGSRFDRYGQAICGPANSPLAPKEQA